MEENMITIKAHAKVNLTLDVLGRRPDGYHDIMSVMQTISLGDTLTFEPAPIITLEGIEDAGLDPADNLMKRAAMLLQQAAGCDKGVTVNYERHIPFSAGLGGGSSDAATILMVLNEIWGIEWPVERLTELAAQLSSDVSFFLYRGTALVQGRGEIVRPLPCIEEMWVVLLKPPIDIESKTRTLYEHLSEDDYTQGEATRNLVNSILTRERPSPQALFNSFEAVAYKFSPQLDQYRQILIAAGADSVHLCGSGPALFTLASDYQQGERIYHTLHEQGHEVYLACTV
jgi:4-diphosphocytidyl-2-C-methyl-D-erythritol kinase